MNRMPKQSEEQNAESQKEQKDAAANVAVRRVVMPSDVFKWRDQKGNFHAVTEMETRHLFFTLRMVWNHSAPENIRIEPFKRYSFGAFYTPDYISEAVRSISKSGI